MNGEEYFLLVHLKMASMVIMTSMGVPVILGKNGMQRVIKLDLEEDDKARFDISQKEDRKTLTLLK